MKLQHLLPLLAGGAICHAASSFSPARPPAIPLAVRSPYMNTWLAAGNDGGNGGYLAGEWPMFWNGATTGWAGMIRVDGTVYTWMGRPVGPTLANQTAFEYTATKSIFTMNVAGLVEMDIAFISPVTPTEMLRLSLPFSYMDVTVRSLDGSAHNVQLYTDISAEWVAGDRDALAQWDYGVAYGTGTSSVAKRDVESQERQNSGSFRSRNRGFASLSQNSICSFPAPTRTSITALSISLTSSSKRDVTVTITTYTTTTTTITIDPTPISSDSISSASSSSSASSTSSIVTSVSTGASVATTVITLSKTMSVVMSNSSASTSSTSLVISENTSTPTAMTVAPTASSVPITTSGTLPAPSPTGSSNVGLAYHHVYRAQQIIFAEFQDQAEWGDWYYATQNIANLTHQSGADANVRGAFIANGTLGNINDTNYRPINDQFPVFGFAVDLGSVTAPMSTLFSLSLIQDEAIQFEGAEGTVSVPGLWTSYFDTGLEAVSYFYLDFQNVTAELTKFDQQIATDSLNVGGQNYLTLTSLAVRQAFGSIKLCGTLNDTLLFLKEISSDGNVNTVDVIFPFHPLLLYTNPLLLKLMLDPLFINQESGHWPHQYSIHDLGNHYPNATGHDDGIDEAQPLEECGNMLIMTLAYALRSNDTAYLSQHYAILKQWTGYLVQEALVPADQLSTDDFAGTLANQTNLALKGIVGIGAMARIATLTGNTADAANFTAIAENYVTMWQTLAIAPAVGNVPAHTTLNYGNASSYSLLYNLYGDRLLGLGLVPQSVYDMQSAFYPTVQGASGYGVPLDTRHGYTKADWELFAAAVASNATQDMFIDAVAKWVNDTPTNLPFTDLYEVASGNYPAGIQFAARPVVGAMFSLLALGPPDTGSP